MAKRHAKDVSVSFISEELSFLMQALRERPPFDGAAEDLAQTIRMKFALAAQARANNDPSDGPPAER